jgi:tRNA(fMet)-specific endonuclease VapC
MYLLDTSALSELVKRRPNEAFIARLRQHPSAALFTSAICAMELRFGASLRPDREAFWKKLDGEILSKIQILEFGGPEALVAGDLLAHLKRVGKPVGLEDVLIAATARAHSFTVVTHNVRHFQHLPEVTVEDWIVL